MTNIIESRFGTLVDPRRVALGAASGVTKKGSFYVFSIRVEADDVREYSFTNRQRAVSAREVLIGHLEQKIMHNFKKKVG
ncbi:MAG: hypothetical protein HOD13_14455 [Rhodospirillaceae bacterium]|nr:hypothetical protein [Rhodospirillaceae bacterium]